MLSRKSLVGLTWLLIIGGVVSVGALFLASLAPSQTAGASLPRLNVSHLEAGTFRIARLTRALGYLLLKDHDGTVRVHVAHFNQEGHIVMPDMHWWGSGYPCVDFGPEMKDGKIVAGGVISCRDPGINQWAASEWRWDYSGKNLGKSTDDMFTVPFAQEGSDIVLFKKA